jgi:hypothetical protein
VQVFLLDLCRLDPKIRSHGCPSKKDQTRGSRELVGLLDQEPIEKIITR